MLRPVTEPVEQRGGRRRWSPRALFALGTLIVLVVVGSGLIGRLTGPLALLAIVFAVITFG